MGTTTPWGTADHTDHVARGVILYGTPSHGGYHLSKTRNALVHEAWRRDDGWYEEDCDWAIVVATFPLLFAEDTRVQALWTLGRWHPDAFEAVTGWAIPASVRVWKTPPRDGATSAELSACLSGASA